MKKTCLVMVCLSMISSVLAGDLEADSSRTARMQWFKDAKLGIFIHWGVYAVNGIDESWSFYNGYIGYEDYMKQVNGFTADSYNPRQWADLIAESGARYAVLTAKHHDGVALWPTQQNDLHVQSGTPANKDLVGPFCKALRKKKIRVGLYYSHLDWSHPDYPHFTSRVKRYNPEEDPRRWERFLAFRRAQIRELAFHYHPDLFWFDGDWDFNAALWKSESLRREIQEWLPRVIVNSRINGYGDYGTPEQGLPLSPPSEIWELCMTMNDSWGYQPHDTRYKSAGQIIRIFAECISMGGNLLLDIGPRADGSIPGEQEEILTRLGRWTRKHQEAIYGTRAGLPPGLFAGPTTLSADGHTLYLFLPHRPQGSVMVKGLKNNIHRIRVVGEGTKLHWTVHMKPYWSNHPGLLFIDVPESCLDSDMTVLAILTDGPVEIDKQ